MDVLKRIENLINIFTEMGIHIAIAESCTGGYVSNMITNISGASNVFDRGIVCYSNKSKVELVNVDPNSIETFGAVSETIAKQLAHNIRILSNVEIGIGITGIAGPTGGTPEKPVGLVFIGFSNEKENVVKKYRFKTNRIAFKEKVLEKIIQFLETFNL